MDYYVGECFFELSNYLNAIKSFNEAMKRDYNGSPILYKLAVSYYKENMYPEAISTFRSLIANYPKCPEYEQARYLLESIEKNVS